MGSDFDEFSVVVSRLGQSYVVHWKIDVMTTSLCRDSVNLMPVVDPISSFNALRCWILFPKMFV